MKPFNLLVHERMKDPERAVRETLACLDRWKFKSGSKEVTLDEVAWLASVFALAGVMKRDSSEPVNEIRSADGSRVVVQVATDTSNASDRVGGAA